MLTGVKEDMWPNLAKISVTYTANCSGLQTVSGGLANRGSFRLTFGGNKRRLGPTITANEPTFHANSPQTAG
jgi:hypothetical protein